MRDLPSAYRDNHNPLILSIHTRQPSNCRDPSLHVGIKTREMECKIIMCIGLYDHDGICVLRLRDQAQQNGTDSQVLNLVFEV